MCLIMEDKFDMSALNKMRAMGHVLVKGYKIITNGGCSIYGNHAWGMGWNRARGGGKTLSTKTYKVLPWQRCYRRIGAGIHVFLFRMNVLWSGDIVQPVWFYADEVRGAWRGHSIVINRVLVKRKAWGKGLIDIVGKERSVW